MYSLDVGRITPGSGPDLPVDTYASALQILGTALEGAPPSEVVLRTSILE